MAKIRPCFVCGKMTNKLLFNDKMLDIVICSKKCENEYLNTLTLNTKERINALRYIDEKIEKTKRHGKIGWVIAGFGLLIVAIGFFTSNVTAFIGGVFPLTGGAISTRYFEEKIDKLTKLRKQVAI